MNARREIHNRGIGIGGGEVGRGTLPLINNI